MDNQRVTLLNLPLVRRLAHFRKSGATHHVLVEAVKNTKGVMVSKGLHNHGEFS